MAAQRYAPLVKIGLYLGKKNAVVRHKLLFCCNYRCFQTVYSFLSLPSCYCQFITPKITPSSDLSSSLGSRANFPGQIFRLFESNFAVFFAPKHFFGQNCT